VRYGFVGEPSNKTDSLDGLSIQIVVDLHDDEFSENSTLNSENRDAKHHLDIGRRSNQSSYPKSSLEEEDTDIRSRSEHLFEDDDSEEKFILLSENGVDEYHESYKGEGGWNPTPSNIVYFDDDDSLLADYPYDEDDFIIEADIWLQHCGWQRDLTQEGIHPNPGPAKHAKTTNGAKAPENRKADGGKRPGNASNIVASLPERNAAGGGQRGVKYKRKTNKSGGLRGSERDLRVGFVEATAQVQGAMDAARERLEIVEAESIPETLERDCGSQRSERAETHSEKMALLKEMYATHYAQHGKSNKSFKLAKGKIYLFMKQCDIKVTAENLRESRDLNTQVRIGNYGDLTNHEMREIERMDAKRENPKFETLAEREVTWFSDSCCELTIRPKIADTAKFKATPYGMVGCKQRKFALGFSTGFDNIMISRPCSHNAERALLTRQLLPAVGLPSTRASVMLSSYESLVDLYPVLEGNDGFTEEEKIDNFLRKYPVGRRNTLINAKKRVDADGNINHSVTCDVKANEVLFSKGYGKDDPRAISNKDESFLMATGPEFYSFYKTRLLPTFGAESIESGNRFIMAAGMNPVALGDFVARMEREGYVCVGADASRWDGHCEVELTTTVVKLWEYWGLELRVVDLLKEMAQQSSGKTRFNAKYKHTGKKCSGGIDTTAGNTIGGFLVDLHVMKTAKCTDYYVLRMGDDVVYFVRERNMQPLMNTLVQSYEDCGHVVKAEYCCYDTLEFCSGYFWNIGGTRVWGPKPFRALAKSWVPHNFGFESDNAPDIQSHMRQVAMGYRFYTWLPVLGPVVKRLLAQIRKTDGYVIRDDHPYKFRLTQELDVDEDAVKVHFSTLYEGLQVEAFDYLDDIAFERPGMAYTLPGFDVGNRVDGVEKCVEACKEIEWRSDEKSVVVKPSLWQRFKAGFGECMAALGFPRESPYAVTGRANTESTRIMEIITRIQISWCGEGLRKHVPKSLHLLLGRSYTLFASSIKGYSY